MNKIKVINPKQLTSLLRSGTSTSRVLPVDATWVMGQEGEGKARFLNQRLPDATFFELDDICVPKDQSEYPHMLAKYETLGAHFSKMGLNKSDKLVCYDTQGVFSGPRVAWNLALAGHKEVYFLDHFKDYVGEGFAVDKTSLGSVDEAVPSTKPYEIIGEQEYKENYKNEVIEFEQLYELIKSDKLKDQYLAFDARAHNRYTGEANEPRPIPSGHIKHSSSLPFKDVLTENGNYKSKEDLLELFRTRFGVDLSKPLEGKKGIIVMCGSGVTAVILKLAIESVADSSIPVIVYDGSWSEYAKRADVKYIMNVNSLNGEKPVFEIKDGKEFYNR